MSIIRRITNLFRRRSIDSDIAAELQAHIDFATDANLQKGLPHAVARRDALLRFGNPTSTRERVTAADTHLTLASVLADLRYASRQLLRNLSFTSTATLVLALGLGSFTAIFAFVDAALIKPLPYRDPSRLVALFESISLGPKYHISYQDFLDWKRMNRVFSGVDVYDGTNLTLATTEGQRQTTGAVVSAGFFRTLGVAPIVGRDFRDGDDLPGAPCRLLLTYASWQQRYGGRGDLLGKPIAFANNSCTIIGVLPREFHFAPAEPAEFWLNIHPNDSCGKDRGCHNFSGIARLKDGITLDAAQANLSAIADQLARQFPDADANRGATAVELTQVIVGNLRPILTMLLCGAALLVIIACVNLTSLLLVHSESRKREFAVRGAIGASPGRLIRQLITEGLLLVFSALVVGLAFAQLAVRLLLGLLPSAMLDGMPFLRGLGLNARVILVSVAISLIAGVIACLVPAMRLSRSGSGSGMREALAAGQRGFSGTLWRRFGSHLVALELAIAVVLLVCAGLLGKSFYRLLQVPLGMRPESLVAMRITPNDTRYPKDEAVHALRDQIEARVAATPGVSAVGITDVIPVGWGGGSITFHVVGRPWRNDGVEVLDRDIDENYFPTIGAQIERGRAFTRNDDAKHPHVVIINHAMAHEYFPGEDPIGKSIVDDATSPHMQIIGIVQDIREGQLDAPTPPAMYMPIAQDIDRRFFVVARSTLPGAEILPILSSAVATMDPTVTITQSTVMTQRIHDSPSAALHRISAWLVGSFAGMALLLSIVGLYGVISYSVSRRTREIGVRIALGAERKTIYRLILSEAGRLTIVGLLLGLTCSIGAAMLMRKLLFGVHAWDGSVLATVPIVLAACALLAAYLPAHRAAAVDPIEALRSE